MQDQRLRSSSTLMTAAFWLLCCPGSLVAAAGGRGPVFNAADFATDASGTGGIQEAIDALPEEGGSVYVPAGTQVLRQPIVLRPGIKLVGSGKGTVLKKGAAYVVKLAADAEIGHDHFVVQDPSKIRVGDCVAHADKKFHPTIRHALIVTKVEGRKVYFRSVQHKQRYVTTLWHGVSVANEGCLVHLFVVVLPARDAVIMDMTLDGNASEQMLEWVETSGIITGYGMLWAGIYPANRVKVERCWIHDCGIGIHVNGEDVEVRNCEIYNSTADGIHCGGGPGSFITGNRIHSNKAAGISFCYGNRGLIITGNHIYDNLAGIYALGIGDPARDITADRYTIISNNIIYRNKQNGISSGQGVIGPQDFLFTGNVVKDNWQNQSRRVGAHALPAGITLYNAKRCVVTGNRCMDDQDMFPRALDRDANAGDRVVYTQGGLPGIGTGKVAVIEGKPIRICDANHSEVLQVKSVKPLKHLGPFEVCLDGVLACSYRVEDGAKAVGIKTQPWGLFVGGPEADDNVVANNICRGNIIGGILWNGRNSRVANNVGRTVAMDRHKSLQENVYPAIGAVAIPNPGFELESGWHAEHHCKAGKYEFAERGRSGKRALHFTKAREERAIGVMSDPVAVKPNTYYRLSAWVKSQAKGRERLRLPHLFLYSRDHKVVGGLSSPILGPGGQIVPDPGEWGRVSVEARTGPMQDEVRIFCRLEGAVGEAWVDDISLDELEECLGRQGGSVGDVKTQVPFAVPDGFKADGHLTEAMWSRAAKLSGFRRPSGNRPTRETRVLVCYDQQNLYVAFECDDPRPDQIKKDAAKEAGVFQDDSVAILLQPDLSNTHHFQFAVSAGGSKFDQVCSNGTRNAEGFNPGWQAATRVTKTGWLVETAIPFAALVPLGFPGGQNWGANFGRVTRDRVISSWARSGDWHRVDDYAMLTFAAAR